jgi:hypothetical protein
LPLWGERQRERTARRLPANFRLTTLNVITISFA